MPVINGDVIFPYRNSQGDFLVKYAMIGNAAVYMCANPDAVKSLVGKPLWQQADLFNLATGDSAAIVVWRHRQDLISNRHSFSDIEILCRCRDLFLTDQISQTPLQSQSSDALSRVSFDVTLLSGRKLKVTLREDGVGYVVKPVSWRNAFKDSVLDYQANYPYPSFSHSVSRDEIIRDSTTMRTVPGPPGWQTDYEDLFWSSINPNFTWPWIRTSEELETQPITFLRSHLDEVRKLLQAIAQTDDDAWSNGRGSLALEVHAETKAAAAELPRFSAANRFLSVRARMLVKLLLTWAQPYGERIEFGGGTRENWSGYSRSAQRIELLVSTPSGTERMEAFDALSQWAATNSIDIDSLLPA